jgi:hypothetical protein
MVATRVIGCGYNYPFVKLIIHHGSFKSFVVMHQESSQLAHDDQLGINKVISSMKFRTEVLHINSSFIEPNVGSWTWKIVDGTIFIQLWMVNPNGVA